MSTDDELQPSVFDGHGAGADSLLTSRGHNRDIKLRASSALDAGPSRGTCTGTRLLTRIKVMVGGNPHKLHSLRGRALHTDTQTHTPSHCDAVLPPAPRKHAYNNLLRNNGTAAKHRNSYANNRPILYPVQLQK